MNTVEAVFQIPDWIANGLDNGNYERVGGVIREVDSKSVVAWLRETDFSQVSPGQVLSSASRLLKFGDAVGVLNLGVSVTSFALILNRIKHLEASISEQNALLTQIDRKLDMGFYGNFVAAIGQANDAMIVQNPDTKRMTATHALNRLLEAQHNFETMCKTEIASDNKITDKLISTLFLAYTATIRCYMELGEMALAASKLGQYAESMRRLVQSYLEASYATFNTHYLWCVEDTAQCRETMARIWRLESSLGKDVERHKTVTEASESGWHRMEQSDLKKAKDNLTKTKQHLTQAQGQTGFYAAAKAAYLNVELASNEEVVRNTKNRIQKHRNEKQEYYAHTVPNLLTKVEGVIEDMRRFEAYQDEVTVLQKIGISLNEWQNIHPNNISKGQAGNMFLLIPQNAQ